MIPREPRRRARVHRRIAAIVTGTILLIAGCGDGPTRPDPPALSIQCPAPLEVASTDGVGAQVTFAPAIAGGTGAVTTVCSPASGATLPVGEVSVACTASDAAGQSAACSFRVRVVGPPRLRYTRFLAFGDSITEGKVSVTPSILMRLAFPGAYPERLQAMLSERYTAQTFDVLNRGRGGEELRQGRSRLPGVLEADAPEVLLLQEGINNIRAFPTERLASDLRAMVQSARRRNIDVMLALLLPVGADREASRPGSLAAIDAFNEEVRRISHESGLGEPVDLHTPVAAEPSLLGADGLHPTEAGYERIAQIFFRAITERWELPPDSPPAAPAAR